MTKVKEEENRAKEQAISQFESIADMVERLEHAQKCEDAECDLSDAKVYAGLNLFWKEGDKATEEERENYHNEDEARQAIQEDPLSVQVRGGWRNPGVYNDEVEEYEILLCTGGPAVRIVGGLNEHGEPDSAKIEFQDWGTYWEEWRGADEAVLLSYAKEFYFGE